MVAELLSVAVSLAHAGTPPVSPQELPTLKAPAFRPGGRTPEQARDPHAGTWAAAYGGYEMALSWTPLAAQAIESAEDGLAIAAEGLRAQGTRIDLEHLRHVEVDGHDAAGAPVIYGPDATPGEMLLWICPESRRVFVLLAHAADDNHRRLLRAAAKNTHCHDGDPVRWPVLNAVSPPEGWERGDRTMQAHLRRVDGRELMWGAMSSPAAADDPVAFVEGFRMGLDMGLEAPIHWSTPLTVDPTPASGWRLSVRGAVDEFGALGPREVRVFQGSCPRVPELAVLVVTVTAPDVPPEERIDPRAHVECAWD